MTTQIRSVGLVSPRYPPAVGGLERHVEALGRGLARLGISVEVITTDPTASLPASEECGGVLIRRFPTVGRDAVYFVAPGLGWWLWQHASRFDVLHAHSYHTPLALQAAITSRWRGVPLIITPHYHGTGHSLVRRALHPPYRLVGRWMLREARRVVCVSESERQLLHQHFGSNLTSVVIPNGVDAEALAVALPRQKLDGRVIVLTVGRLEHYKQTERLVAALPYLPPEYEVVVVGDGPARSASERLARRLGVQGRLTMSGRVAQTDLLACYRTADIFVSLSRLESFGLTLLEAAAAGLNIVASDIPAHREVAGYLPAGRIRLVSPEQSPHELAGQIQEMRGCDHAADGEQLRLPNWDTAVEATLECYRAALRDGGVGPEGKALV